MTAHEGACLEFTESGTRAIYQHDLASSCRKRHSRSESQAKEHVNA